MVSERLIALNEDASAGMRGLKADPCDVSEVAVARNLLFARRDVAAAGLNAQVRMAGLCIVFEFRVGIVGLRQGLGGEGDKDKGTS